MNIEDIDIEIKICTGGQVQITYDGYKNYSSSLIEGMIALYESIGKDLTLGQINVVRNMIYKN